MENALVLGIDIGGSHITLALVDLQSITILPETYIRKSVNSKEPADAILNIWAKVIEECFARGNVKSAKIGIAMPGPFDYEKGICLIKDQDKYENFYGLNLKELLAMHLQIEPEDIRMMNDASGFMHGEVLVGSACGFNKSIGLTLGTGLGSARFDNGIVTDADLWRMPFKGAIAEDYISTRWFVKRYSELTGKSVKDVKHLSTLIDDPKVLSIFEEFGENLALFLAEFIKSDQPEVVVLGGNISMAHKLFLKVTEISLMQHGIYVPLRIADQGEEKTLIGAAGIWHEKINKIG